MSTIQLSSEMYVNELLEKIRTLEESNSQLLLREKILKHRLAHIMWLKYTDEFSLNKNALMEELINLDAAGESHLELEVRNLDQRIMYLNKNWFVNTHLDEFLSRLT